MPDFLPRHLRRYITSQDQNQYTPIDHAVWRYILRQLKDFLQDNAHESYLDGLEKTGITIDEIPRIEDISSKLQKFGWRALPVSGFIPPSAFMELQSLSILPIASDMRSIDHLLYTPAPDIVHEAAGHAPILIHQEFAEYLKSYAQIAKKALISFEDLEVYNAIRDLSDTKENPQSNPQDIHRAEERLKKAHQAVTHVSEAALLGRMNWWTAEYGLIGDINRPKIFGAGLLSSVGEAKWCLSDKVNKIPLSIDCLNYSYDITEPQPQLFVARDFRHLRDVLEEMSQTMAYRIGGPQAVEKAILARTVNTVQFETGLQVSGECKEMILDSRGHLAYLIFRGPSQLSFENHELIGHGCDYHREGFGTPVGSLKGFFGRSPASLTVSEWTQFNVSKPGEVISPGDEVHLEYSSGLVIHGVFRSWFKVKNQVVLLSLEKAKATYHQRILFQPDWGVFDLSLGERVTSVYAGPSDRSSFGEKEDFEVARVPRPAWSASDIQQQDGYQTLRNLRKNDFSKEFSDDSVFYAFCEGHLLKFQKDWLFALDAYEISIFRNWPKSCAFLKKILEHISKEEAPLKTLIDAGLQLLHK
jgi:phenylalanine-4-hydroxylase